MTTSLAVCVMGPSICSRHFDCSSLCSLFPVAVAACHLGLVGQYSTEGIEESFS